MFVPPTDALMVCDELVSVPVGVIAEGITGDVLSIVIVTAVKFMFWLSPVPVDKEVTLPIFVSSSTMSLPKVKLAYPKSKFVAVVLLILTTALIELFAVSEELNLIKMLVTFKLLASLAVLVLKLTKVPSCHVKLFNV